jgi:hypothetical protein
MNNPLPIALMKDSIDLYGFAYVSSSGSKTRNPVIKKAAIRCMVQDTPPQIITWYYQRNEKVSNSLWIVDPEDYSLIEINDRIVYQGMNFRVAGRHNEAGLNRIWRIDIVEEM